MLPEDPEAFRRIGSSASSTIIGRPTPSIKTMIQRWLLRRPGRTLTVRPLLHGAMTNAPSETCLAVAPLLEAKVTGVHATAKPDPGARLSLTLLTALAI